MVEFVHCWDCRLPVTPSGRRFIIDGEVFPPWKDPKPEQLLKTCQMAATLRKRGGGHAAVPH